MISNLGLDQRMIVLVTKDDAAVSGGPRFRLASQISACSGHRWPVYRRVAMTQLDAGRAVGFTMSGIT